MQLILILGFLTNILYLICLNFLHYRDVNNAIMELLIIAYACKTSCARSIVAVIPYLPYSKQSQMRKRGSIVAKLLATMLCKSGKNFKFVLKNLSFRMKNGR